jgi:hypothetical protein
MPELYVFGEYAPKKRQGTAIWLRCVIAGCIADASIPAGSIPVIYLPGVGRDTLRDAENCPSPLHPLVELQYRGTIWYDRDRRGDWTVSSLLRRDPFSIDIPRDDDTRDALQLALSAFLNEDISQLKGARLDGKYFRGLLLDDDPIKGLLQWIGDADSFRKGRSDERWTAFVNDCGKQYGFDPEKDGPTVAASHLASQAPDVWEKVWQRFCEDPEKYRGVGAQIEKCTPTSSILWEMGNSESTYGGWPQWNRHQERKLRDELLKLADASSAGVAAQRLLELEKGHGNRRTLPWARLGDAPLAQALEHLANIVRHAQAATLAAGCIEDIVAGYQEHGWRVDDGVLRALDAVSHGEDVAAVTAAIRAVYVQWADDAARYLQKLVLEGTYPGGTCRTAVPFDGRDGDCVLFVDGLRYDVAVRLAECLRSYGLEVGEEVVWAALPSVTATGKPAVSPVREGIVGGTASEEFNPSVVKNGLSEPMTQDRFRGLLNDAGWSVLAAGKIGEGKGRAWCESGNIDHVGHSEKARLAKRIAGSVNELCVQIQDLVGAGWRRVLVVTDHGWLLVPGAVHRVELPSVLVAHKWGRCASLNAGAMTQHDRYPWYWDPDVTFVLPPGITSLKDGQEYTHGGLSVQECLTLRLTVSSSAQMRTSVTITGVTWRGLRCNVTAQGGYAGCSLDVRRSPKDASSSLVSAPHVMGEDGTASVVVGDEDLAGQAAWVVMIDAAGTIVAQRTTGIGGDD